MQLTRFTDASLRVLMHLAQLPPGQQATTLELAERYNIPYNHLHKAVHHLSKVGWISAARGRNGGIRLAAAPSDLTIGQVVRSTEPPGDVIDCLSQECPLRLHCGLKGVLNQATQAFYAQLDRTTLADVVATTQFTELLPAPPAALPAESPENP
ncbi:Rrf2 family transcriptional regulator [Deinococcus psychrotolerans]|uniref:Rrf2 family transcriptional regulator n=1 Tax=Deinococcus psychrotolerans TaxID=2489213 RepID=A0A3G8YGY3_9DEIO|nr:Rrf2 family transcriptional regulator [Deinococcus psychrotolerans]AZI41814.1 Rrf2 family transcriptional regulator [Deinococcus psychrotolerans]